MGMAIIQPYILVSNLKKTKTKFLRCTCYLNSIKTIKQDVLLNLVLVRQHNVLHYQPHVLQLLKTCFKYCEKVYGRSGKNPFWSIKIQVKFR